MIEVFKTNVTERPDAVRLINTIHEWYPGYKANFDLDDCDRILRINSESNDMGTNEIIQLLKYLGYEAEVLPDDVMLFEESSLITNSDPEKGKDNL